MKQPDAVNATLSPYKFLEYITHELANPLNGMLMSVELIGRFAAANPRAASEIGGLLKSLNNETNRLAILLKELQGSGVMLDCDRQPTSLAAEISDLLVLESAYYEQRQVRIHQEFPADLPAILADRSKLRQVLLNLCKNAVEAMPSGGTLTIRCCAREAWLCLDIADTGNGIPEGIRVFEPAVTDKPRGSGLGLAIVREIVQQHEGTVSYTTQLGKGTTFHLKFPIPTVTPANAEEKPQAWREDYHRRSQDDQHRWGGDSSGPRASDSGRSPGSSGALIHLTDRQRADDALQVNDVKSPMDIAGSCSAALLLVSTGLVTRAATQGVDQALFSTAIEYGLKVIKPSPKLVTGNWRRSGRVASFSPRLGSSQECSPNPQPGLRRKR